MEGKNKKCVSIFLPFQKLPVIPFPACLCTDIFFYRMNNTRKEKGVHETEMGRRDLKKKDNSPCLVFLHPSIQKLQLLHNNQPCVL